MKKAYIYGTLMAAALTPAAMAIPLTGLTGTISLELTSGANFGGGGQFTAIASGAISGTFQTWCLESGVQASAGFTYNYVSTLLNPPQTLPLEQGTAWLYTAFLNNPSSIGYVSDAAHAAVLQGAMWFLQGESAPGNNATFQDNAGNPDVLAAVAALGADATAPSTGQWNVVVLELEDANGVPGQNVLAQVPNPPPTVPDGGSTVGLLGFVLLGVEALRRKLAR
jgi:hypothetical protein